MYIIYLNWIIYNKLILFNRNNIGRDKIELKISLKLDKKYISAVDYIR